MIRQMDYLYTLLKFIIGGSVIVGVTFLAEHVDPRYGGMIAAAPIITTLAFLSPIPRPEARRPVSW